MYIPDCFLANSSWVAPTQIVFHNKFIFKHISVQLSSLHRIEFWSTFPSGKKKKKKTFHILCLLLLFRSLTCESPPKGGQRQHFRKLTFIDFFSSGEHFPALTCQERLDLRMYKYRFMRWENTYMRLFVPVCHNHMPSQVECNSFNKS